MNRHEIDQLWERHRDGELSDDERARFESHLKSDERDAALFEAESQWLAMLREPATRTTRKDAMAFTDATMKRWEDAPADGVLARFHWRTAFFSGAWAAAAAMIAVVMWINQPPVTEQPAESTPSRYADSTPRFPGRSHPLTSVVNDVADQFDRQPRNVEWVLDQARTFLDMNELAGRYGNVRPVSDSEE